MAERPAWTVKDGVVICEYFEFSWNSGFAIVQKKKNIVELHESINKRYHETALEVSSKSTSEVGKSISAFSLKKNGIFLENMFQGAKKYEKGGPYIDMLDVAPKEAKIDERHQNSGKLLAFVCGDVEWPLNPQTAFYDYLYVKTLISEFGKNLELTEYHWFTDIEFNPKKSINCQARSAAIYKLIQTIKYFDAISDMKMWIDFHEKYVKG